METQLPKQGLEWLCKQKTLWPKFWSLDFFRRTIKTGFKNEYFDDLKKYIFL
jgi:hypothetical protein